MEQALPFSISPEAAQYIGSRIRKVGVKEGCELVMVTLSSYESSTFRILCERVDGEFFVVSNWKTGEISVSERVDLFGFEIAIAPQALNRLNGKTLVLRQEIVGRGFFGPKKKWLLRAV